METKRLTTSSSKIMWGLQQREKLPVSQESLLESAVRAEQEALFPLGPPPPQRSNVGCPTLVNTSGSALYNITGALRQRNMAQMKEHIKTPEKKNLSDEEIDNLSGAEFKTLVIRMLPELIDFRCKMKEEMKAIQSEVKENVQGTNCEGKETGTQINVLEQKEDINIPPQHNE